MQPPEVPMLGSHLTTEHNIPQIPGLPPGLIPPGPPPGLPPPPSPEYEDDDAEHEVRLYDATFKCYLFLFTLT